MKFNCFAHLNSEDKDEDGCTLTDIIVHNKIINNICMSGNRKYQTKINPIQFNKIKSNKIKSNKIKSNKIKSNKIK